jgi:hypothetical protein
VLSIALAVLAQVTTGVVGLVGVAWEGEDILVTFVRVLENIDAIYVMGRVI